MPPVYLPCGILRHPPEAMTCEASCPFTGYGAHSVLMGDGSTGLFCLLIPQTEQQQRAIDTGSKGETVGNQKLQSDKVAVA
jgi:hypothetical protein